LSSSTTAKSRPTFSRVASQNAVPPRPSKRKDTTGWPPSKASCASTSDSPETITRSSTTNRPGEGCPGSLAISTMEAPAGIGSVAGLISVSTNRKVILATLKLSFSSSGLTPGTCSRMRRSPWRCTEASRVPVSSTRRRMISIAWVTTLLRRSSMYCSV